MKLSLLALLFLLLALAAASSGEYCDEFGIHDKSISSVEPQKWPCCCKKNNEEKLSKDSVSSYFHTSSECRQHSVKFVLKKKGGCDCKTDVCCCADPKVEWVKELMAYLDEVNKTTTSAPTTVPTPSA